MLLFLQPPFTGGNREKTQQKIVKERIKLPAFLSAEAHSLLKGVKIESLIYVSHFRLLCEVLGISSVCFFYFRNLIIGSFINFVMSGFLLFLVATKRCK